MTQGFEFLIAATVYVFCTGLIAVSCIAFAKALSAAHSARLHASQAAATEQTLDATDRALQGAPARSNGYRRPTSDELLSSVRMQRDMGFEPSEDDMGDSDANAGLEDDMSAVGGFGDAYQKERIE